LVGGALGAAGFVASADQRAGGAPDCELLPGWLGLKQSSIDFSMAEIVKAVAIFLAVPLVAGCLTRRWGEAGGGREWYETRFLPRIGPVARWASWSPSCCCSRCKARGSPTSPSTWRASPCRWLPISP